MRSFDPLLSMVSRITLSEKKFGFKINTCLVEVLRTGERSSWWPGREAIFAGSLFRKAATKLIAFCGCVSELIFTPNLSTPLVHGWL